MLAELEALSSRTNLAEGDLQFVLEQRDAYLAEGNEREYARTLLVLAHVVKWVRSDNAQPPFERASALAFEALEILNRLDDAKGVIDALLLAAPMNPKAGEMLEQAMTIAESTGDELIVAQVLHRQASHLGLSDRKRALELQRKALELYTRNDHIGGQAACLFSLAIQEDDKTTRQEASLRSAELYRAKERYDQAARAMTLALVFGPKETSLENQRTYAERGLQDAQLSGERSLEGGFYQHLARISALQGNLEDAEKFHRWEQAIVESDGLTAEERETENAKARKYFAKLAKSMGFDEAVKAFRKKSRERK